MKDRRGEKSLFLTACHEAGHAVAAARLGYMCGVVTIVPDGDKWTAGHAATEDAWDDPEANILVCLAGYVAELEAGKEEQTARAGAAGDFEQALGWLGDTAREADLAPYLPKARELVRENWAAIERVAAELVARQTIDGDMVEMLRDVADGNATEEDFARYCQLVKAPLPRGYKEAAE
jgi:ATP-dependent Zn protease